MQDLAIRKEMSIHLCFDKKFKANCHNPRTVDDIDMKLGPVTKIGERNKQRQKILTMTSFRQIVTSL